MINITGTTKLVGVIGWPIGHSLSPPMHNAAFEAMGLNWAYVPLPVSPEQVKSVVTSVRTFGFAGINITVPHKQAIMRYVDEIDSVARSIGAVNTIAIKDGKSFGYNTDSYGFHTSLLEGGFDPRSTRCLVLGAGGAARAVVFSLASAGASEIAVYNRTVERAAFLVEDLKSQFPTTHFSYETLCAQSLSIADSRFDLVINTTSAGMGPKWIDLTPWPEDVSLPDAVFCDLVYNPIDTKFLRQAQAAGHHTIDGVGMLVHQGARSFEYWTGQLPPTDVMRQVTLDGLTERRKTWVQETG